MKYPGSYKEYRGGSYMDIITIVLILIAGVILFTILKSFFKALLFVILIILVYYGLMYFIDGSVESIQSSLRIFH